jgi:ADP-heptose:LPS heptosyltransferase
VSGHVLVARQDSLGDVLLAGPAVRAVAAGAGRVTLLCGPRGLAAAELLPGVDAVVVAEAAWIDPEPEPVTRAGVEALVERLAALAVDQALVLTSFHQSPLPLALLLRMAGVPTIAAISVDYPGSLLDVRHRVDEDLHEVERGLSLAAALGYRLADADDGRLRVRRDRPAALP